MIIFSRWLLSLLLRVSEVTRLMASFLFLSSSVAELKRFVLVGIRVCWSIAIVSLSRNVFRSSLVPTASPEVLKRLLASVGKCVVFLSLTYFVELNCDTCSKDRFGLVDTSNFSGCCCCCPVACLPCCCERGRVRSMVTVSLTTSRADTRLPSEARRLREWMRRGRTLCSTRDREAPPLSAAGSRAGASSSASFGTLRSAKTELSANVSFSRTDKMLGVLPRSSAFWAIEVDDGSRFAVHGLCRRVVGIDLGSRVAVGGLC